MRMEVVNRIESVIKELWPSADVSTAGGGGGVWAGHRGLQGSCHASAVSTGLPSH